MNIDFQSQVQDLFFGYCEECHGNQGTAASLDLQDPFAIGDSIRQIVGVSSSEVPSLLRVDAGNPSASFLMQKINCDSPEAGSSMPWNRPRLTIEQQGLIYDWIYAGAYGEIPNEKPVNRDFIFRDGAEWLRQ